MVKDHEGVFVYLCAFFCWPYGLFKWISIKDSKPNAAQNVIIITIIGLILSAGGGWQFSLNFPGRPF